MATVHLRKAEPHEVGLEVNVVDGEMVANVRHPAAHEPPRQVERMQLLEAAVMAAALSERFGVDIAVVDLDER